MPAADPDGGWRQLFWLLFERTTNPTALLDGRRRITDVNDAVLALIDRGREQLLGVDFVEVVIPAERADAIREFDALLRSGEYAGSRELLRSDGSTVAVDFTARLAAVDGRRLSIYVVLAAGGAFGGAWPLDALDRSGACSLTKREREVVGLIATGRATRRIAEELHVSPDTVRTHVRNAMSKVGAHTRAELVAIVVRADRAIHVPRRGKPTVTG